MEINEYFFKDTKRYKDIKGVLKWIRIYKVKRTDEENKIKERNQDFIGGNEGKIMQVYRIERSDYWKRTNEEVVVALTKEEIRHRLSATEFIEWYEEGYRLYEYCLDNVDVIRGECIITKDNAAGRSEVSYKKIWNN